MCKNSDATLLRLFGHEDERTLIFQNAVSYTLNDIASLFRTAESRRFSNLDISFSNFFDTQMYCIFTINKNVYVI